MTTAYRLAVVAPLAAALVVPSSAGAVIQLQRGIAGARLGSTQKQVRAALGKPARVQKGHNELAGNTTTFRYRFGLEVQFAQASGGRVANVSLKAKTDRTSNGVGVGTRERVLRTRIPKVKCSTEFRVRTCMLGKLAAGQRVSTFFIRRGVVRRVEIGVVFD
jgi:hypothetical protein